MDFHVANPGFISRPPGTITDDVERVQHAEDKKLHPGAVPHASKTHGNTDRYYNDAENWPGFCASFVIYRSAAGSKPTG